MTDKKPHFLFSAIFNPVSSQDKINFARHLSVSIKSGMPLLEGLKMIRNQSSKKFAKILDRVIKDVNNGQFLAQSLENFGSFFGSFFTSMVKVGETSGNLSASLLYLAQEIKKQKEINSRIRSALIYPFIILIVTIGITLFLTLFIFPKILPIFVSLRIQLPFTTRFIIQLLSFLQVYGLYALGGLIVFFVLIKVLLAFRKFHFIIDRLMLLVPFVSKVTINITLSNFTRSLGVLLKSGMTIVNALDIAKDTFHNLYYRREVTRIIISVQKGESIARYLGSMPKLFPPMFTGMVQIGESTGNLEENLNYLSDYYEGEVDETLKNLTTVLEPLLLLVMGLLVGFVALSIITPIYQITQGLNIK